VIIEWVPSSGGSFHGYGGRYRLFKSALQQGAAVPPALLPPIPSSFGMPCWVCESPSAFFGILTSNLGFSEAECLIIGSQMDFGTPKGYGFLWIPSVKWMILECEEKSWSYKHYFFFLLAWNGKYVVLIYIFFKCFGYHITFFLLICNGFIF